MLKAGVREPKKKTVGYCGNYIPRIADIPFKFIVAAGVTSFAAVAGCLYILRAKAYDKNIPVEVMDSDLWTESLNKQTQRKYRE